MRTSSLWKENWPKPCDTHTKEVCCSICHPALFSPTSEEAVLYSTEAITEKLVAAKKAYYPPIGNPIMSDSAYDAMELSLQAINPNADFLEVVGDGEDDET